MFRPNPMGLASVMKSPGGVLTCCTSSPALSWMAPSLSPGRSSASPLAVSTRPRGLHAQFLEGLGVHLARNPDRRVLLPDALADAVVVLVYEHRLLEVRVVSALERTGPVRVRRRGGVGVEPVKLGQEGEDQSSAHQAAPNPSGRWYRPRMPSISGSPVKAPDCCKRSSL